MQVLLFGNFFYPAGLALTIPGIVGILLAKPNPLTPFGDIVIKTLVILAVAYGLRALLQPHGSSGLISRRRRRSGHLLLYSLATLGAVTVGGMVFLIVLSVQATPPSSADFLSNQLVNSPAAAPVSPMETGAVIETPPVQNVQPGTRPAYVLLNTPEPVKSLALEQEKPRPRVRPKVENKAGNRTKSKKKP